MTPTVTATATATATAAALDLDRPAGSVQRVALLLDPVDGWQAEAACRWVIENTGEDPFYSTDDEPQPVIFARQRRAKRICAPCPVRLECLRYALETREPHGIWGGLTVTERRDLLAKHGVRLPKLRRREPVGGGW
jgi:WhiB family redox-sensing transcriptional regulator